MIVKSRYQFLALGLVLAIVCSLPPVLLVIHAGGLHSVASFKDFIVSDFVFNGYNKRLELYVILLFLFCDFLILPLLLWQREKILWLCKTGFDCLLRPCGYTYRKLLLFFRSPIFNPHSGTFSLLLLGFLYLLFQVPRVATGAGAVALYPVIFTYAAVVFLLRRRPELFPHACMTGIGCYFSLMGLLVAWHPGTAFFADTRLYGIPACCAATLGISLWLCRQTDGGGEEGREVQGAALAWLVTPCLLFALARYTYIYEGESVELYKSWFSSIFFNIFVVLLLCGNVIALKLQKYTFVYTVAAVCLAIYFSWTSPNPIIPSDFFHYGEISTPLQQWLEFGKIPFIDYHPVHGLCDYFYAALGRIFFDGSYASLNAGIAIGTSLQAALQILVLALVYPGRYATLLLAIFLPVVTLRWFAVGLCLPLSLWFYQRRACLWFFLWSAFSGLFCVLWNVPMGAAYCAALMPLLAAKFWAQRKCLPRPSRWQMWGGAILCLLVLALAPMLKALLANTLLTASVAPEAHGNSVLRGIMRVPWPMTLSALLFIPFLIFLYIRALSVSRGSGAALLLPVSLTIFSLICANYGFLRYDDGSRSTLMGLVLIVASIPVLNLTRPLLRFCGYTFLAAALLLTTTNTLPLSYTRIYEQQEYVCTKDFMLPTNETINSIGNLGHGFIPPATLDQLKELRAYIDANGRNFANLDFPLALYCILNIENHLKFQTSFNIESINKQKESLTRIKDNQLRLALLPAYWDNCLNRPLYYLQTRLHDLGFYPDAIVGKQYLFLKKGKDGDPHGQFPLGNVNLRPRIQQLGHLPQVWSQACSLWTQPAQVHYELKLKNCERTTQGGFISPQGGTVTVGLHFARPVSTRDFSFITFSIHLDEKNLPATASSPDIAGGKDGYSFWLGPHRGALPVFLNYAWMYCRDLKEIYLEIQDVPAGKAFTLDIGFRSFQQE